MAAIYQTFTADETNSKGVPRSQILITGNSGREKKVQTVIMPGPQSRGIRRESVFLRYNYQTTAKNPSTLVGNKSRSSTKIKI